MKAKRKEYEFDAAISFAGEDRRLAKAIARAIQSRGFNVFYDHDQTHRLWGKGQAEFEQVYGPRSRFVISLISKNYIKKEWTRFEFGVAKDEEKKRKKEFILPVRIDATRMLGLPDDRSYLHASTHTPERIAHEFAKKCVAGNESRQSAPAAASVTASLFSPAVRRIAHLLATAVTPMTLRILMRVIPEMPWKSATNTLLRAGVVRVRDERLILQTRFRRTLEEAHEECREARKDWISSLSKLQQYVDLNLHLAIQYLVTGEIKAAVERIVEAVEIGPLGPWAPVYLACLSSLQNSRIQAKLNADDANRSRNALGLCHGLMNQHQEAYRVFTQLVKRCRRKNQPQLGNALLNAGVACHNLGRADEARRWYREAIEFGRKRRDHGLVGKALGNLSQSLADDDPVQAAALLDESISQKRKAGIPEERAIEKTQKAALAVRRGDFLSAAQLYDAAAADDLHSGNSLDAAWSLIRAGGSHLDAGNTRKAISAARRARKIAADWDADEIAISALTLEARACHEAGKTPQFAAASEALLALTAKDKSTDSYICALRALAVARAMQKNSRDARRLLRKARNTAERIGSRYWILRCTVDALRQVGPKGYGPTRLGQLAQKARDRERAKAFGIAGDL